DVEKYLRLPVSGLVPNVGNKLVVYEEPSSFASESYRSLRANIQALKIDKSKKTILITSSNPKEQNDIVSINLAGVMATPEKVLLIDGNIRRPSIHGYFDMPNDVGLSNVLIGDVDYKKAIKETAIDSNLHVLVSGPSLLNPAELLASDNMQNLLKKVKEEYDTIIVNSPSLGGIADAITIGTMVDGVFLVCALGKADIEEVRTGKELVEKVNADILGIILTSDGTEKDNFYKYYHNSYSYYSNQNMD